MAMLYKYVGDGLMAIFREAPGVGHHANRAVYAALDMLERLRDFNKGRAVHHQQAIHIRIGVHSGPTIVGNIGCYGKMDYTAIGTAVILASRLEQYASTDSVCISDATYQLLGGYFHALPGPDFVPKGFAEAQCVWQVCGPQPLLDFIGNSLILSHMLIYNELKNKPREFLAATGLKLDEFEQLLPAFQTAYEKKYPPEPAAGRENPSAADWRRRHRGTAEDRR